MRPPLPSLPSTACRAALASRLPLLVLGVAVRRRQHRRPAAPGCRVAPQRGPARPSAGLHAALVRLPRRHVRDRGGHRSLRRPGDRGRVLRRGRPLRRDRADGRRRLGLPARPLAARGPPILCTRAARSGEPPELLAQLLERRHERPRGARAPARRPRAARATTKLSLPSFAFALAISPSRRAISLAIRSRSAAGSTLTSSISRSLPTIWTGASVFGSSSTMR